MTRKPAGPVLKTDAPAQNLEEPIRPQVHLRRSNRNLAQSRKMTDEEDESREIQGKILGIRREAADSENATETVEDGEKSGKEGLRLAIEGLARMERRLQRATKRQKMKVEETHLTETLDQGEFKPRDEAATAGWKLRHQQQPDASKQPDDKDRAEQGTTIGAGLDPENEKQEASEEVLEMLERGAARPPPVNSHYLPLPWRGRLGYACLNTYLRSAKPPVFSSRTCRMASIIDHRYPLADPDQPEHATKNRPDKSKTADHELGVRFVQNLGLQNAADIVKMMRWNAKYGIKFMRLSSEMFPFASHVEHGYKLATFASKMLAEVGRVAAELGHRLTTHPGQFTQLGSPRKEVIEASVRDLEYHDEMLTLLRLPEQQDRDAVMILHMGGAYGDKAATLDRFRANYAKLSQSVKNRLVLENDDVSWSVHDLLPICEELNIPLVLDYHHHNIIFDYSQCREGTLDISQPESMERITATWRRKGITQKMHYSEPCPGAVTPRDRRKHSPRVMTLPPCPPGMDLMIEAKDKEQAVFELMRTFKLPGFEKINDMVPHERMDEPRPAPRAASTKNKKKAKAGANGKRKRAADEDDPVDLDDATAAEGDDSKTEVSQIPEVTVTALEFGMGGPENRVYWPPGMEEWLKPRKRQASKNNKAGKRGLEDGDEDTGENLEEAEGI
ncbi:UV-endonuclease UvdE-domain-containing protein [Apiosordaria backusii]|uniref:UV-endonuclease UvdE-domain-containing protein n=1 Tax=Apiosordaria backusii TaxID=314023 RepID=A0AA39ZS14_9PEZI|nr:UV-endonuclease UvdE-domain-containing protein [Apiosordaria backusii]